MAGQKLIIQRLHLHESGYGAIGNPVAWKLGLQQALRQVQPRAAHLPPQAILVIRRLESRSAVGLPAQELHRWRRAVQEQIDELARQALRPGRQHVPPHTNSVLFDDQVDLLLCYTRDLLAGRQPWYWVELFPSDAYPGQPAGQRLAIAWQNYPQAIPHTLVNLQPREAAAALNLLTHDQLSQLVRRLHDTFALAPSALNAFALEATAPPTPGGSKEAAGSATFSSVPAPAPWREWLPPARTGSLPLLAAYLLGLSYSLVKRPPLARQPAFARQARRWLAQAAARRQPAYLASTADRSGARLAAAAGDRHGPAGTTTAEMPVMDRETNSPEADRLAARDRAAPDETTATPDIVGTLGSGTFTRLGGAVFFINLMTRLGLPEAIPELAGLNPWELLGGLVAGLLGRRFDDFEADPLWGLINQLVGLEADQPWGTSLPAPGDSQLPDAWLDVLPLDGGAADDAAGDWTNLIDQLLAPNLAWWVRRLRPYLAQYLRRLIPGPADPVDILFHQPATLHLSRTHLDLLLSIEQISLPLRRAGLDQSPGWRPAFGYIVTIHFE